MLTEQGRGRGEGRREGEGELGIWLKPAAELILFLQLFSESDIFKNHKLNFSY